MAGPNPPPLVLLAILALLSIPLLPRGVSADGPIVNLGLLLPFPEGDSAVPERLAQEWISASKVALQVLSQRYQGFSVNVIKENSNCDSATARDAAQRLLEQGVVGVVGPACSDAAKGALEVLGPAGVPVVSFAATTPELGSEKYPTFFRTAFSDEHQAKAVVAAAQYFSMKKIVMFNTQDTYGTALADAISAGAKEAGMSVLQIPVDAAVSVGNYSDYFTINGEALTIEEDAVVVFATSPNAAEGLWRAALDNDQLAYPWWYLGTDGATAFDLVGQGDNLTSLVEKLQGEIGIAPYKGDFNMPRSPLTPFYDFWVSQPFEDYPGLLTLPVENRFKHPRAYVTSVIDAVWSFYEAFSQILISQNQTEVSATSVLQCLCDRGCVSVKMTTGQVEFDCRTGERRQDAQAPQYSFVNVVGLTWEEKGRWAMDERGLQIDTSATNRPGPIPEGNPKFLVAAPAPPSEAGVEDPPVVNATSLDFFNIFHDSENGTSVPWAPKGWSVTAIALTSVTIALGILAIVVGGIWLHRRRQEKKQMDYEQFVHVLPEPYLTSFPLFNK